MTNLWEKLNLKGGQDVLVLDAPKSFSAALKTLPPGCRVRERMPASGDLTFVLAFAQTNAALDKICSAVLARAAGDPVLWFAYPKGTSKKFACDFNRDKGWDVLRASGFDSVRQVSIDDDWSALRFRRAEFINRKSR